MSMLYYKIKFKIDMNNDELLKTILKFTTKLKSEGGGGGDRRRGRYYQSINLHIL
jgi:hypothetical protein